MGLTAGSTGNRVLGEEMLALSKTCDYTVAFAGNPNVGKSTVFNGLTGMHQHTGNWPGKTVANASGSCQYKEKEFLFVDIPGTYSLMSNSQEEEIARNYICFGNPNATVVIVDATCLERNLNLVFQTFEITKNVIVCVNLLDEAKKKGISIDLDLLSSYLGVPVVGTTARKPKTLHKLLDMIYRVCSGEIKPAPKQIIYSPIIEDSITKVSQDLSSYYSSSYLSRWICLKLIDGERKIISSIEENLKLDLSNYEKLNQTIDNVKRDLQTKEIDNTHFKDKIVSQILSRCEEIAQEVCHYNRSDYNNRDRKIDKILTSKKFGIPIMLFFLAVIFWITIIGANYPSELLSNLFRWGQEKLLYGAELIHMPQWLSNMLILGMYQTVTWVIAVMLPPMAIFFPLFTILEDLGYLPRIAFNLDHFFKKACTSGKQALTMCMGFGCNAAGVIGCRIIDSPRERLIATLTNAFVPCNGRFPFLITIASIFIAGTMQGLGASFVSTLTVLGVILLGIFMTLLISKLLSKTVLKGFPSSFILELPPYRKPQVGKVLVRSILDRTLFVLGRAISVAAPAGIVLWLFANLMINGTTLLTLIANFLNPFAQLMGLDGYILTAFLLGLPANEIVLPIILMSYIGAGSLVNLEDTFRIGEILAQNGWTILTAINVMIFALLHFPCSTTLLTIKKETNRWKWTILSFLLPTVCGIVLCMCTTFVYHLFIV